MFLFRHCGYTKIGAFLLFFLPWNGAAQSRVLKLTIHSEERPLAGVVIRLPETGHQTATDTNGVVYLKELAADRCLLVIDHPLFRPEAREFKLHADTTFAVLQPDNLNDLEDVVITATRTYRSRIDAPVAITVLDARTFLNTQSACLADGLAFQPGLRMETDCQTCNYTQLRMNGLGGSYAQLLINGRPLFSSLMGLYGLEQIPANAIDRVEVMRGSGSVLYGSNAIAGTVNVITKSPEKDELSITYAHSLIAERASDVNLQINAVAVNDSANAGISVFGAYRKRDWLDVNNDGFSELPRLNGLTMGVSAFANSNDRNRFELALWHLQEERRGGNAFDLRPDEADQSEYRLQNSSIVQLNYDGRTRKGNWQMIGYTGWQFTDRSHYTGIDQADGWGTTRNVNSSSGYQLNRKWTGGRHTLEGSIGADHQYELTHDAIPGYGYLIDQEVHQLGVFLQTDWQPGTRWNVLVGARSNWHSLLQQPVWTPRVNLLFKATPWLRFRAGYGRGFKGPQAFEADMHIAFASGGIAMIVRDPALKSETSDSWTASVDWNKRVRKQLLGVTVTGFYTVLHDVFTLSELGQDSSGNTMLFRSNGAGAFVAGFTFEARWKYADKLQFDAGWTMQRSQYQQAVSWSTELAAQTRFLRTPDQYGFATLVLFPERTWSGTIASVVTGSMLVPHFGGAPENPTDKLVVSPVFTDLMCKFNYTKHLHRFEHNLQFSVGVQNLLQQYQTDFDSGKNRDSNYIYGPSRPRTVFVSIRWFSAP